MVVICELKFAMKAAAVVKLVTNIDSDACFNVSEVMRASVAPGLLSFDWRHTSLNTNASSAPIPTRNIRVVMFKNGKNFKPNTIMYKK